MQNLLRHRLRENSTFEHPYFSGGLPWDDSQLIEGIEEGLRLRDTVIENRMLARHVQDLQKEIAQLRARLSQ